MAKCVRCETLQSEVEFLRKLVTVDADAKRAKAEAEVEYMKSVAKLVPERQREEPDEISSQVEPQDDFAFTVPERIGQLARPPLFTKYEPK